MSEFVKHGLTGNTKRRAFAALLQRQQGKCAICGISQKELLAVAQERHNHFHPEKPLAPVHSQLHIDHCHRTGYIRGLLCPHCNSWLGYMERYVFRRKPDDVPEEDYTRYCEDIATRWLEVYWDAIFAYMQQDRWFPRKDILFHLQGEKA